MPSQLSSKILMVRPQRFGFNPETAASNSFQKDINFLESKAFEEFDRAVENLRSHGIDVVVENARSDSPDAVFPNNWVSFHDGAQAILYPMESELRRSEVNQEIVAELGNSVSLDVRSFALDGQHLEGTGSLVFDRVNGVAFACNSSRTSPELALSVCEFLGYDLVLFDAFDSHGGSIYHTNVVLSIGEEVAIICSETIPHPTKQAKVLHRLFETGREVIDLSREQMNSFGANVIQVRNCATVACTILSTTALKSMETKQLDILAKTSRLVTVDVSTIEQIGGGSIRCMIAELF